MTPPLRKARSFRAALGLCVLAATLSPSPAADGQAGPSRSRWWDEVEEVRGLLDGGKWQKAARRAERVREELMRTSWREPDLGDVLAELAFQAAVARANLGEDEAALWEWSTALIHEHSRGRRELGGRDLSGYGGAAELLAGRTLRAPGEAPPGREPATLRPDRDFEPPAAPEDVALEPLENSGAVQERPGPVVLEVLIDREGGLHDPVLTTSWSHPVVVQWALDSLRRSAPYRPATLEGEPVEVLWPVEADLGQLLRGTRRP